ncbi:hypothetical protein ACJX0J_032389, partial [Zea mays]
MTIDESRKRTGKTGRADLSEIDSTAVVRKYVQLAKETFICKTATQTRYIRNAQKDGLQLGLTLEDQLFCHTFKNAAAGTCS